MRFAVVRLLTEMRSMLACRRGQVAIIFAFAATMLVIAVGMGIDLWQAYAVKARLQSALDAAALAIASTDRTQLHSCPIDCAGAGVLHAPITPLRHWVRQGSPDAPGASHADAQLRRHPAILSIVSGSAWVPTTFMRIVGVTTLSVSTSGRPRQPGRISTSTCCSTARPRWGLPQRRPASIPWLPTPGPQGGCAFGCHETNPAADSLGNPAQASSATCNPPTGYPSGGEDNYALARCLGVQLRIGLAATGGFRSDDHGADDRNCE